jgi:hypothetical protein
MKAMESLRRQGRNGEAGRREAAPEGAGKFFAVNRLSTSGRWLKIFVKTLCKPLILRVVTGAGG